jgi:hypothetical protein
LGRWPSGSCERPPPRLTTELAAIVALAASHGEDALVAALERATTFRRFTTASHWPFDQWGRFLPEHTTAVSMLDRLLHHATVVVTEGESFRMKEARARGGGRPTTH